MKAKIGINGFGRIGRIVFRAAFEARRRRGRRPERSPFHETRVLWLTC